LQALRNLDLILAVGRDDALASNNRDFSGILWRKGLWHALRIWDGWCHDWPYWHDMVQHYIGGAG
jgi:esterase/lipase superfamily enzyme